MIGFLVLFLKWESLSFHQNIPKLVKVQKEGGGTCTKNKKVHNLKCGLFQTWGGKSLIFRIFPNVNFICFNWKKKKNCLNFFLVISIVLFLSPKAYQILWPPLNIKEGVISDPMCCYIAFVNCYIEGSHVKILNDISKFERDFGISKVCVNLRFHMTLTSEKWL